MRSLLSLFLLPLCTALLRARDSAAIREPAVTAMQEAQCLGPTCVHGEHVLAVQMAQDKHPEGVRIVLYGDGLVEALGTHVRRGTNTPVPSAKKGAYNTEKYIMYNVFWDATDLNVLALGIARSTVPRITHRMEDGELPEGLNPKAIVLMAGSTDILEVAGRAPFPGGGTYPYELRMKLVDMLERDMQELLDLVKKRAPNARVILSALHPILTLDKKYPNHLIDIIDEYNRKLINLARERTSKAAQDVRYADCTQHFVEKTGSSIAISKTALGRDGLHPSRPGYTTMLRCLEEAAEAE